MAKRSAKTRAKMRAAWKIRKRRKEFGKQGLPLFKETNEFLKSVPDDLPIGTQLRIKFPADYTVTDQPVTVHTCDKASGLIDRMTQAIDKIEQQIKRLETL
jgi:hypothetical protein